MCPSLYPFLSIMKLGQGEFYQVCPYTLKCSSCESFSLDAVSLNRAPLEFLNMSHKHPPFKIHEPYLPQVIPARSGNRLITLPIPTSPT